MPASSGNRRPVAVREEIVNVSPDDGRLARVHLAQHEDLVQPTAVLLVVPEEEERRVTIFTKSRECY